METWQLVDLIVLDVVVVLFLLLPVMNRRP